MKQPKGLSIISVLLFSIQIATAQTNLREFNLRDFDKVQIDNINGQIEIELGKPFGITIAGNEGSEKQIELNKVEDKLIIKLDKKYSDDWKKIRSLTIKISMPEISKFLNNSNADVSIKNFVGRYLGIENNGNGNTMLVGTHVDYIEIENYGNGNTDTKNINSKKVTISKTGNGNVSVKTENDFTSKMTGNGDIINYGTGKAIINKQSGNGKVLYNK
jgi:hypothetical protein